MVGHFAGRGIGMMGFGGNIIMLLGYLILLGFLIFAYIKLSKQIGRIHANDSPVSAPTHVLTSSSAMNILDERFAKGEITAEEYKDMKINLQK